MKKTILSLTVLVLLCLGISASAAEIVDSGTCGADGDNLTWTLDSDGLLTINGTGDMADYVHHTSSGVTPYYSPWYQNYSVKSVIISNGVTSIGDYAFNYCNFLTSAVIPDGVKTIGNQAFAGCYQLKSIAIPDSVTSVGISAFASCQNLSNVSMSKNVKTIGRSAFYNCYKLCDINIPYGITTIEENTFFSCQSLMEITLPNSVQTIGMSAFACCGIVNMVLPDSVTDIGMTAFNGCENLISITIPDSVQAIGSEAFLYCPNLPSITIPAGVQSLGNQLFTSCYKLTDINVDAQNQFYSSADGILYDKEMKTLVEYPFGKAYTPEAIPDSVITIGHGAFYRREDLKSIIIPKSITNIGQSAFAGCREATSIVIPESVKSIGDSAFNGCSKITAISIPEGVAAISNSAFAFCSSLTSITIPDSVQSIGEGAFKYCYELKTVYYGGSSNQWNNINIDNRYSYNSYLLSADIVCSYKDKINIEKNSIYQENNKVFFSFNINAMGTTGKFVIAFYNEDGTMTDCKTYSIDTSTLFEGTLINQVEDRISSAGSPHSYKAFFWSGFGMQKPYCTNSEGLIPVSGTTII